MNTFSNCFNVALSLVIFLGATFPAEPGGEPAGQSQPSWQKVGTREDNFSLLMPVVPAVLVRGPFTFGPKGEGVRSERVASAYYGGVVYLVSIYESSNPKRLAEKYRALFRRQNSAESVISVKGLQGKQLLEKGEGYYRLTRLLPTKSRLYVIEAAARDEHPDLLRFHASVSLDGMSTSGAGEDPGPEASSGGFVAPAVDVGPPFSEKEVTRPAVMIYKPQPRYTPQALQRGVSGKIKVSVILTAGGEVSQVQVIRGLGKGLDEGAMAVAKLIKFIPAEKDGRLVSQVSEVEYSYQLYN